MALSSDYYNSTELAELYDLVPLYGARQDIRFYIGLCREAPATLELGCGTGRVLIPAAQAGCTITGLDQSPTMLARCRAKLAALPEAPRKNATLVQANLSGFHLDRQFDLITIPFRPFQHLVTVEEQLRCLECARAHLKPQGRLVFDVFHPKLALLIAPLTGEEIEDTPEFRLPDGRTLRRTFRLIARNLAEQCNQVELIYYLDEQRFVQAFPMHYYFRYELEHLLALAGLKVAALYGDYDGSEFRDESPDMIFTAVPV